MLKRLILLIIVLLSISSVYALEISINPEKVGKGFSQTISITQIEPEGISDEVNIRDVNDQRLLLFRFADCPSPCKDNQYIQYRIPDSFGIGDYNVAVYSHKTGTWITKKFSVVDTCDDGTYYGGCSVYQPKFCSGGALIPDCNTCGCPGSETCGANGECGEAVARNVCNDDDICGTNSFTFKSYKDKLIFNLDGQPVEIYVINPVTYCDANNQFCLFESGLGENKVNLNIAGTRYGFASPGVSGFTDISLAGGKTLKVSFDSNNEITRTTSISIKEEGICECRSLVCTDELVPSSVNSKTSATGANVLDITGAVVSNILKSENSITGAATSTVIKGTNVCIQNNQCEKNYFTFDSYKDLYVNTKTGPIAIFPVSTIRASHFPLYVESQRIDLRHSSDLYYLPGNDLQVVPVDFVFVDEKQIFTNTITIKYESYDWDKKTSTISIYENAETCPTDCTGALLTLFS